MKKINKSVAVTSAITAALLLASSGPAVAQSGSMEKCYGIAKAGKMTARQALAHPVPAPAQSMVRAMPGCLCLPAPVKR